MRARLTVVQVGNADDALTRMEDSQNEQVEI